VSIFDGLRRVFGGESVSQPDGDGRVRATFSPWTIIGDDIAKQYDFQNLGGPGTETMFQVRCTVEMGSLGFLHHHVHFVMQPAIVMEECYLVAFLATMDEEVESGFFPVKVAYLDGGGNLFWVEDRESARKCLAVLHACKPMQFMVLDKQECLVKIPLENDSSYRARFSEIQDQVSKR